MPNTAGQTFEFRGVDKFHFAVVTKDDADGYTCSTPISIPVQEIGKSVDSSSEAHYYDNKPLIVVSSESADTITIVNAPPELKDYAQMTGKSFDATTGMMVDSPRQNKYFALAYRTKGTDGKYRYVTRLKGTFNIPEETVTTENDGTDTTNTTFEYTGINTQHEFTKGIYDGTSWKKSGVKGIVVDERYGLVDFSNFFDAIQTPDTITPAQTPTVTGIALAPSTLALTVGDSYTVEPILTPEGATGTVTFTSSTTATASVDDGGKVTALEAGTTTITATCGGYSDTCAVTVTAASA